MLISIIIPTCDRFDELRKCLQQITCQINIPEIEVIVSDDGQHLAAAWMAKDFPECKWTRGPGKGPAANRNHAARHAKGTWLLFLDDDVIPDPQLILNYRTVLDRHSGIQVLEGATHPDRPQHTFREHAPVNISGQLLWSCNFMIQKALFDAMGGFDERFPFPAMEDVDLRYRIRKQGIKTLFCPEAVVIHPWRHNGHQRPETIKCNRSADYFYQKYPELLPDLSLSYRLQREYNFFIKYLLGKGRKSLFRGAIIAIKDHFYNNKLESERIKRLKHP